jgi:hypothetical protein
MSWIKRNLYFVIGTALALALIGLAGWYLYSKWALDGDVKGKLNEAYNRLVELCKQNPYPKSDKIDNIKAAQEQQKQLADFKARARAHFQPVPAIPDLPKAELNAESFATALSRAVNQLQRDATNASIGLPSDFAFSFGSQIGKVQFPPGSLEPLSAQLGEVKAICDVLFAAKINTLDSVRRERASPDDVNSSSAGDYLAEKSVTNAQAVLMPYEVTFHCFSQELAAVLAGFASSPCAMVVKAFNVKAAPASAETQVPPIAPVGVMPSPTLVAPPPVPAAPTPTDLARQRQAAAEAMARRYGLVRGGVGDAYRARRPPPAPTPPLATAVPAARGPAAPAKPAVATVLDEKQLEVVVLLEVVKLIDTKGAPPR